MHYHVYIENVYNALLLSFINIFVSSLCQSCFKVQFQGWNYVYKSFEECLLNFDPLFYNDDDYQ